MVSQGAKKWLRAINLLDENVVQGQEELNLSEKWSLANEGIQFDYFEDCRYLYELQDLGLIELLEFENGFGMNVTTITDKGKELLKRA